MSSEPLSDQPSTPLAAPAAAPVGATAAGPATSPTPSRTSAGRGSAVTLLLGAVAAAALVSSGLLWQKLSAIQEQLARQSADAGAQAIEARTMARQAEELVRETAARLSVAEARVSEVALQRSQLEELMQSLSRSRDSIRRSFLVRPVPPPLSSSSTLRRRWIEAEMVFQLVSMPPSQRELT